MTKMEEIIKLMDETPINPNAIHKLLAEMNEVDIAETFELLSRANTIRLFRLLHKNIAADVFSYIEPDKQQIIVEALTDAEIGKIVEDLFADDAVDFIEEMPSNVVKRVLRNVSDDTRKTINHLLQYPEDSAGSIMTTEFVDLKEDSTVAQAFEKIRSTGVEKETIYTCYVVRRDRTLIGVCTAKRLMLSDPQDKVSDIMESHVLFAQTTDDQEKVADMFRRYGLISLPIVDKEQRLVGIVTIDDVVLVIEEEATEDIEIMAALTPSDAPYLKSKVTVLARNRIAWLMILMLSATFTGMIISEFEDALAVLPLLVTFLPMLMGTGGNAASQSSVLIIRGMALGEIEVRDVLRVWWREVRVGLICGSILGIVNFVRVFLMYGHDTLLSLTITISLIITVVIAKSVGCMLPIFAKVVKIDPAVMAAPMITTLVDAASLIFFFTIAKLVLGI